MALIYEFPSEKQRKRAATEAMVRSVIAKSCGGDGEIGDDVVGLIMETYDRFPEYSFSTAIVPPVDEPFTEKQVKAINDGLAQTGPQISQFINSMFYEILTQKFKLLMAKY